MVAIERGSVRDCDHVWTVVYDRLRFHRKMSRVQGGVSLFTIQVCYKNVYLLQLQFLLGFRDISPPLKDTFLFRPTYFWPMQNDLVYLGILQTKFQTTAIIDEDLLHNEAHSTSCITLLIFQRVNPLLPKGICVHWTHEHLALRNVMHEERLCLACSLST